jgi:hypothetical protein
MDVNIYINQIITEWKDEETEKLKISRNKNTKTLSFVDNQVTTVDSEDSIQISIQKLETITSKYGIKISTSKMKTMDFKEKQLVRCKIVINNNNIEQITTFNKLGCSISDQNKKDIKVKISEFLHIMGIIRRTLKPLKSKNTLD